MDFDMDTKEPELLVNVSISPAAFMALNTTEYTLDSLLRRHVNQDYGAVPFESKFQNDFAFHKEQGMAVSRYPLGNDITIVITTRWNQPVTSVSLEGIDE